MDYKLFGKIENHLNKKDEISTNEAVKKIPHFAKYFHNPNGLLGTQNTHLVVIKYNNTLYYTTFDGSEDALIKFITTDFAIGANKFEV